MADLEKFHDNPQLQLLEEIKGSRCVMLGSPVPHAHMQPMAPQVDLNELKIFFYSDNTSELGKAILSEPAIVHLCHIEKDYQACIKGRLSPHFDDGTIDKFWGPIAAAWYPGGKDDPKMLMLKFEPIDAAVWASDASALEFVYEIAKANLKNELPDLGEMRNVKM